MLRWLTRLGGARAVAPAAPVAPTYRECSAVVAAIALGSFPISPELSPAETVQLLNRYLDDVLGIVARGGGTCLRHVGDLVLAEWPAPTDEPTQRAVGEAIVALVAAIKKHSVASMSFQPTIGLGYGSVVHSTHHLGGKTVTLELGHAVNDAQRLCSACRFQHAEILFYAGVPIAWPPAVKVEELERLTIKGRSEQPLLCRIVGA